MKTLDFIKGNIGNRVYITGEGDLMVCSELKSFIINKTKLILVGLTKGGLAELKDSKGNIYRVRPTNVREINN
jgi:hypothetical protein